MRNLPHVILALFFGFAVAQAAPLREVHLGLSPFLAPAQRDALAKALPAWLLDKSAVPAGTHIICSDAWKLTTIAEFTIPTLEIDTPKSRTPHLAAALAIVGQWLRSPPPIVEGVPTDSAAIRAPEWLYDASATQETTPKVFIIFGSPLYRSPAEPTFDMALEARYPSDGYLTLGLRDSPFGLAEKKDRLRDATVQWCFFDDKIWANELHRHVVTRFWSLYIKGQGGLLTAFGTNLPTALGHALQPGLQAVLDPNPDPADAKPLMHPIHPRNEPAWMEQIPAPVVPEPKPAVTPIVIEPVPVVVAPEPAPAPIPSPSAPPAPSTPSLVAVPIPEPPKPPAPPPLPIPVNWDGTKTGVGIAWSATGVDLDLYVLPHPDAKELYYQRDHTPEGFLYKDERNANTGKFYEFVEFKGNVELDKMSVWVNYFGGSASHVLGQVVLFDHGKVKVGTFTLQASQGNHGNASASRSHSPYWTKISLGDLVETGAPLVAQKPGHA